MGEDIAFWCWFSAFCAFIALAVVMIVFLSVTV
jgi:hypothetical protein